MIKIPPGQKTYRFLNSITYTKNKRQSLTYHTRIRAFINFESIGEILRFSLTRDLHQRVRVCPYLHGNQNKHEIDNRLNLQPEHGLAILTN